LFGDGTVKLGGPLYGELGAIGETALGLHRANPGMTQIEAIRSAAVLRVKNGGGALKDVAYERDISIPGTAPASQSRLLAILTNCEEPKIEAHRNVQLNREDMYRLVVWMDLYALYQGYYNPKQEKELRKFHENIQHLLE